MSETSPTPKRPSAFWKWTKRIGCTMVLLAFTCCGLSGGGLWWLDSTARRDVEERLDRVHFEALRGGDLDAMHANADPAFRERFSILDLRELLRQRPGLLDRQNLLGVEFHMRNGVEYVIIRSLQVEIVFKRIDDRYVLVGISPGMDEFVPARLRFGARGHHRSRWWD